MLDRSTLTIALAAALPASKQAQAPVLVDAIIAALDDSNPRQLSVDASLVAALAGTQVTTADAVLTFGQDNDMHNATITIGDVAGGGIVKNNTIITLAINVTAPAAPPSAPPDHNRIAMLANVRRIWIDGVLKQSLWNDALIMLRLTERPDAIVQPYGLYLRANGSDALFPVGTTIQSVYDAQQGALLILGQPGSGKTTLLLELARTLLDRAESDPTHPIPVVFNLATWQEKHTLAAWLVAQLNREYGVPKKTAQAWVIAGIVLPLLDGLDEVAEVRRTACVESINTYRTDHEAAWATPVIVSCRASEYEALPPLQFHRAIQVQPLTRPEIDTYLRNGGRLLAGVRAIVKDDPTLYELLETPLMLAVTTLAFARQTAVALRQAGTSEERRRVIFAAFIERQFQPPPDGRGIDPRYSQENVHRWLAWLAEQLRKRNQSIYWIEFTQPRWLPQGWISSVSSVMLDSRDNIKPIDTVYLNWPVLFTVNFWNETMHNGLYPGLGFGLLVVLLVKLVNGPLSALLGALPGALLVWTIFGLSGELFNLLQDVPITNRTQPNEGIYRSRKNALFVGLLVGLLFGLFVGLLLGLFAGMLSDSLAGFTGGLIFGLIIGINFGLFSSFKYGGSEVMKHYTLRLLLFLSGTFPWNITAFLDSCAQRRLVQRVGGGWRFPHNLIRDYFAELEVNKDGKIL